MRSENSGNNNSTSVMGRVLLIPIVLHAALFSCATAKKEISYSQKKTYTGVTNPSLESNKAIDRGKTYMIYFKLKEKDKCVKFSIHSRVPIESVGEKEKVVKTYFIVEKRIDISSFYREEDTSTKYTYSEIGRNFDHIWNRKQQLTICTVPGDPIKKFDTGIFRVRFTTFTDEDFRFKIILYSNKEVTFMEQGE
jgi:hypothetical protein